MKKKVIAGTTILALLVTMAAGFAYRQTEGSASFQIEVVVDTTIFIPDVNDDCGGSIDNSLEFAPGITTLDDPEAIAIDTCASDNTGDWRVEAIGNYDVDLLFRLDNASPTGVTISIWGSSSGASNASPYTDNTGYIVELVDTQDTIASWSDNLAKDAVVQIWQRVAANKDAIGGDSAVQNAIIVTSTPFEDNNA